MSLPLHHGHPHSLLKKGAICAEVGVWAGDFSAVILEKQPAELHLIDPWASQQEYEGRFYSVNQEEMDVLFQEVQEKFAPRPEVTIHRDFSTKVSFPKEYFDWVYIDGNHDYEFVLNDLRHYYPLVKKGGFLCGDDYGWDDASPRTQGGPKRAVDEFAEEKGFLTLIAGGQFTLYVDSLSS